MAAIPAQVAGVDEILMATPPQEEGISPAVLVAAEMAGVDQRNRVPTWIRTKQFLRPEIYDPARRNREPEV